MSLSPSRSPSPAGSPATTLPLLPPSPPPVNDHANPPPSFTPLAAPAPVSSPPSPPTPLSPLPQISSSPPIVTSAPPPPIAKSALPSPIVTSAPPPPVSSPPHASSVAAPVLPVAAPPPLPLPNALPPVIAIVPPSPPPGPPRPPLLTPSQLPAPTTPSTSSSPSPSPPVSPLLPATSSTPPASPSPLKAYPPPLVTPSTPLPPPSAPSDSSSPSSTLVSPSPLPSSLVTLPKTPPLQLPLANGTLNKTERSHVSTVLVIGSIVGGVILLLVVGLLCFCYKNRRRRKRAPLEDYCKSPCLTPKDLERVGVVLSQPSQENGNPPGAHVITVIPKHLGRPPSTGSYASYGSSGLGSVNSIPPQATGTLLGFASGTFTYDELAVATNGFSEANLLGEGGFGYVHKGVLQNGKQVAVKGLKTGSHQGEQEFQAEVETISRIHHKHLVSLVGYCITGAERLLVYEFVPNNTLEFHLHGEGQAVMEWETRLKIAVGSAKGLAYLHEDCSPTIIHRDIKASNILLDSNFEAKVSDFGLAKMLSDSDTHISTRVVGTFGYLAPEYASSGKLTDKSDVYSYGIMLLELISGRPPITTINSFMNESLVDWARPLLNRALEDDNFDALVDPKLKNNYKCNEMANMVACAAACVRHSAWLRPRMSQVIRALEGDVSLKKLDESISLGCSTMYSSSGSSNYDPQRYKKEETLNTSLSGKLYGISWHSDSTSEYGLNPSGSSVNTSKQTEF